MLHCTRCFLFSEVPYYHGRPLLVASGDEEYGFYCEWLVAYLERVADAETPDSQRGLCGELDLMDPASAVFWLVEDGFFYAKSMQSLERCIEDKLSYQEAVAYLRPLWEGVNRDMDSEDVEPFEEWVNPHLWGEANREWAGQQAMPLPVRHADVGYRFPLARILARESSVEKRLDLIHSFYDSYNEWACK